MTDVSIIISTKDRIQYLRDLIESIWENTKCRYEIVVIDDASSDGTNAYLAAHDIKYLHNPHSIPVADAWNQGAEMAQGEFLVFLNDDMLTTPDWLDEQVKLYRQNPYATGSLAFKVFDDEGNVQSRGHSFMGIVPYLPDEDVVEVDYSDHPFVSKRLWKHVGGFNAHGHMYYEDSDFGLRLQSRGYKNYYNYKAILKHLTVGLRVGSVEDKKRRHHNESLVQHKSRESFLMDWEAYLLHKQK